MPLKAEDRVGAYDVGLDGRFLMLNFDDAPAAHDALDTLTQVAGPMDRGAGRNRAGAVTMEPLPPEIRGQGYGRATQA